MTESSTASASALDLIEYPSRFPLKVFGKPSDELETVVLRLIKTHCPQAEHIEVSQRASKNGKYVAMTLTFTVHNQQQIKDIYQDLYDCEHVVMSL
ncbi:MAG: DUF493 domain-containing protein [Gammaproteobacteria bacterium]|nr:DUF493 domain-containing protein [Gammaproteobacteria bacterium]